MKIDYTSGFILESKVSRILQEQEEYGVYFDIKASTRFILDLESLKEKNYLIIRKYLEYNIVCKESIKDKEIGYVRKIKNKDGEYTRSVLNHYGDSSSIVNGCFSRIAIEEPVLSKRKLLIKQLLKKGWKPEEFTDKGFPKLTIGGEPVSSLSKLGSFGKSLALWYILSHRQSQIKGFLKHVHNNRIPASCNPCGTNTFRARHKVVANIPRSSSVYGKEMRSLFRVEEGRVFVGVDISGLELRMLAHHMKDSDYTSQLLHGDIHTYNMEKAGLSNREQAKTFIYAFLYGAGDRKIGSVINGSGKEGKILKSNFLKSLPLLNKLIMLVQRFGERTGFIPSIDCRKIHLRTIRGNVLVHTALNALLQANGSIITKRAMVIAWEELKKRELDAKQIIFYHDEMAYDTSSEVSEEVGEILLASIKKAGDFYNLRLPITGKVSYGDNWGIH